MAAFKSELFSLESVLEFYDTHEEAMFRIFAGNKADAPYCRYEFFEENKELGREQLYNILLALKTNTQNTNQYLLQVIKKVRKAAKSGAKPIDFVNVTFQLNSSEINIPYQHGNAVAGYTASSTLETMLHQMQQQMKQQQEFNAQILQRLNEEEEEEEEEEAVGGLQTLLQHPKVMGLLDLAIDKFFGNNEAPAASINGTNDNARIVAAIERLKKVDSSLDSDLEKLADLAEQDAGTFNFLINQLRKM